MVNLTLTIDEVTLKRARLRALESDTTVNALVREYLEAYADQGGAERAMREFAAIADHARAGSGSGGRRWSRDELYDERAHGH